MSIPQIRTEAIEAVGRKILMEYDPSLLSGQPCPVPIETIIETKFDLILEFHTLRKNPKILGETIFDDGAVVLYDQIQRQYRMIAVRAGTILIDERLCDPSKLGRLRFTCAHELAHWVLHKKLYSGTGDVAAYNGNVSSDESHGIIERQADMEKFGARQVASYDPYRLVIWEDAAESILSTFTMEVRDNGSERT